MTKIIVTLEPESDSSLVGMADAIRLNMGKHPYHWPDAMLWHRNAMWDVGQKLRLLVPENESPTIGERKRLFIKLKPSVDQISFNREIKAEELAEANLVVIRDGLIMGQVKALSSQGLLLEIIYRHSQTTPLHNAGINLPNASYSRFYLSPDDKAAIQVACESSVKMLALSNVEEPADIETSLPADAQTWPIIVPKIETAKGVVNLEAIIRFVKRKGAEIIVMAAQGDLFNELGPMRFAQAQDKIIKTCKKAKVPIIIATGLLLSAKFSPLPTRAEITALRALLRQGVDYLMLTDETVPDARAPANTIKFLREFIHNHSIK